MLLGASACGGAIALFAESAVDGSNQIANPNLALTPALTLTLTLALTLTLT